MTNSRLDGFSVMLNCLLITLFGLLIFEIEPFGKVEAGTLTVSHTLPGETTQFACDANEPLPSSIEKYVTYANYCLLHSDPSVSVLDGDVLMMFHRLNEMRETRNLPPLKWHAGAAETARLHAIDMLERQYFDHSTPEGLKSVDRMRRLDRDEVFSISGENLAYYATGWPDSYSSLTLQSQLERSPSHFKAMLDPEFTHAGAAIVKKGNVYIAVQVFLASEGQLPHEWPTVVSPGEEFLLPEKIGERVIGGWRLITPGNQIAAEGYDRRVKIPSFFSDRLRLVVLGEESRTSYILLNAPVADLKSAASN